MLPVFAEYLRMLFWPAGLSAAYDPPVRHVMDLQVAGAALLFVMVSGLSCYLFRRERVLVLGMAIWFIGLVPVSQIVPLITLMNDRYLYFPMLGAGIVFGRIAVIAGEAAGNQGQRLVAGVLCLLVILLGTASYERAKVWQDAVTLWQDAVQKAPRSRVAWFGFGNALDKAAMVEKAETAYLKALELDPFNSETLDNLSFFYLKRAQFAKARDLLQVAVATYPDHRDALLNLGTSAYLLRDFAAAEKAYQKALAVKPSAENLLLLAMANLHMGRDSAAADFYRRAMALGEPSSELLYSMGAYAALQGNQARALDYLARAVAQGYRDCVYLEHDPDLAQLRTLPALQQLRDIVCSEKMESSVH
jgi:Tfp pilus assembly protein PilF